MKKDAHEIVGGYFERSIRSRHGYVLVCEEDDRIVGYMLSRIQKNIPVFKENWIGYLSDAYLQEPFRNKGIGSEMWQLSVDWFRSKDVKELSLRVLDCNPNAHAAYRKWGFKDLLTEMRLVL
jgi:ribosomal protein S18 acetylase RimI-like enzyme